MQIVREAATKLTRSSVDAAWRRRAPGTRTVLPDSVCRGLALVVHPASMTWRFDFKPRGVDAATGKRPTTRSATIGSPETHSPDAARSAARELKASVAGGGGPAATRKAAVADAIARRALTVGKLVEAYAAALPKRPKLRGHGLPSPKHCKEELAQLRAAVVAMSATDKPIADIRAADIRIMLAGCAAMPASAKARFGAVSRFADWAVDEHVISANPCAALAKRRRPRAAPAREAYLTPADLAHLWHAAAALPAVTRDLARALIVLPARRGEMMRMDWRDVNFSGAIWTMPGQMMKSGDAHRLHLPALALELLRARHRAAGEPQCGHAFPAPRTGGLVSTWSAAKEALDTASGLTGWRWHDCRRSFATAVAEAGVAEAVADAILSHRQSATRSGVLGIYQRAGRWPEQQRAMERWGQILGDAIADGTPAGAVMPIGPSA